MRPPVEPSSVSRDLVDRGSNGSPVRILKPSLRGVPFHSQAGGGPVQLLSERQRLQLGALATELRLPARTTIYQEETAAEWVFIIRHGALKSFRELANGKRVITAFLFQDDMFGLAEAGRYVNTIQALTPVTLHRFRMDALADMLRRDAGLEFQFLCKVTHELRQSQRQLLALSRRHAMGRLAMFLQHSPGARCGGRHADRHPDEPCRHCQLSRTVGGSRDASLRQTAERPVSSASPARTSRASSVGESSIGSSPATESPSPRIHRPASARHAFTQSPRPIARLIRFAALATDVTSTPSREIASAGCLKAYSATDIPRNREGAIPDRRTARGGDWPSPSPLPWPGRSPSETPRAASR